MQQIILSEWLLGQLNQSTFPNRMPNHRRIYETIRRAITERILPSGTRLPSTRSLSLDLNVSRNTILAAFEQLLDEGYVSATTGSGTYVSFNLHQLEAFKNASHTDQSGQTPNPSSHSKPEASPKKSILSQRGEVACNAGGEANQRRGAKHEILQFTPGPEEFNNFPFGTWRRLLNRHWRTQDTALLDASFDGGYLPLRKAIANYLKVARAVNLSHDQVLITSGTRQSIDLCARLLTDHGDTAWIESPGYWAARRVLEVNGLKLHPVNVDNEGMAPTTKDFRITPRLIYTTPSHQYPKGMVMGYGRRRLLLDFAQTTDAWIIEDDYDSEFRFEGRPISSLQGMDLHERVLYLGTFSKVVYPGIRLGYMVVPPKLVESFKCGLYELQQPGQVSIQAALADFIEEGHFTSQIRRLKQIYSERRSLLQAALAPIASAGAKLSTYDSGLHLVVEFDGHIDDVHIAERAAEKGLNVYPLSNYCLNNQIEKGLIIGYAYAPTDKISSSGSQLAQVICKVLSESKN